MSSEKKPVHGGIVIALFAVMFVTNDIPALGFLRYLLGAVFVAILLIEMGRNP